MTTLSERLPSTASWRSLRLRTKVLIGLSLATITIAGLWVANSFSALQIQTLPNGSSRIVVNANGNFQQALNVAKPGDVIVLEAGAEFTGPFTLPVKEGSNYITIQSSRLAELPEAGKRVSPSHAALMPKILAAPGDAAIKTELNAHHYQFIGVEIAPNDETSRVSDLIKLGASSGAQKSLDTVAHHLILDRCYIHGFATQEVKRGVALNSAETSIINSYISDIHGIGYDTQAICGWNGPGPYRIINNYLEAAGENVMFGGADPSIPNLIPSDIEIRGNHFFKPLSWKVGDPSYAGKHWTVKNLFELKNARRVVVDGNTFENSWLDAQVGFAILIKSQNQDRGCPWCVSEDVTFTNNIIRNVEHGINVLAYDPNNPSGQVKRLRVVNNLWVNVRGMWFQGTDGADDVLIEHNTHLQQSGNVMTLHGRPTTKFVYRNNITVKTGYGVKGDGLPPGLATLNKFCPGYAFQKNVIAGQSGANYPPDNFYPASLSEIGFVSPQKGDYRLASSSRYRSAGTDKRDPGCDFAALDSAISKGSN
ncbi:MAG TPA: hypothetical protein VJM12_16355 [Pyrinomonadaceae bacterium]|nr:hypothetical protein [Pyrinomonadaceae bacterium]